MKELKHLKTFESFSSYELVEENWLIKSRDEKLQKAKSELENFPKIRAKIDQVVSAGERNGGKIPQDKIDDLILKYYSNGFKNFEEYKLYPIWSKAQDKFIFSGSIPGFIGK